MPLYEYKCTACHKHTEKIQKFSDPEITTCPKCGGLLERVITAPAIAFKGGGWYADGYGNAKPAASGESKAEGTAAPSTDAKSDSKQGSTGDVAKATPTPAAAPAPASPSPTSPAAAK